MKATPTTPAVRFWAKVQGGDYTECWIWTATLKDGYGIFSPVGTTVARAHRWAYELMIGPIPDGLQLDHLCRNRACVNPWHLDPVTTQENSRRGSRPMQTHCLRGHPFDASNTRWRGNLRNCKACDLERNRKKYWRRKGLVV